MTTAPPGPESADGPVVSRSRRVNRFHWALLAITLCGFAFRAAYVIETRKDDTLCGSILCGDALYYSGQANVIGLGHGVLDPRDWKQP